MATRKRYPKPTEPPALDIKINIDKLTWEDMRIIVSANDSYTPEMIMDITGLFDRIIEGGAKAVPVVKTMEVMAAIGETMKTLGNPKNSTPA